MMKKFGIKMFDVNSKVRTIQINLAKVLKLTNHEPLFGDKRSKTRWIIFMK